MLFQQAGYQKTRTLQINYKIKQRKGTKNCSSGFSFYGFYGSQHFTCTHK